MNGERKDYGMPDNVVIRHCVKSTYHPNHESDRMLLGNLSGEDFKPLIRGDSINESFG